VTRQGLFFNISVTTHTHNHFNSNFPGLLTTLPRISPQNLLRSLRQYFNGSDPINSVKVVMHNLSINRNRFIQCYKSSKSKMLCGEITKHHAVYHLRETVQFSVYF